MKNFVGHNFSYYQIKRLNRERTFVSGVPKIIWMQNTLILATKIRY